MISKEFLPAFHGVTGTGPTNSAIFPRYLQVNPIGLLWMAVLMTQMVRKGLTIHTGTRLMLLSLFWHFLDIVWINIFTFVYLMGVL